MVYINLKKLRLEKNISLQEMADGLGLKTAGGYLRIEKGENKLKAEHLPIIADRFGIKLDKLISELFFGNQLDQTSSLKPA